MNALQEESCGHKSVMVGEVAEYLVQGHPSRIVDGTLGLGGHSLKLLKSAPGIFILGLDRDAEVLDMARKRLMAFQNRIILRNVSYTNLRQELKKIGWNRVDGILLDLGVCSYQIDHQECGFSFQNDAPLDLRFSRDRGETAAELLRRLSEKDIADLIFRFGEEPKSRRIAHVIKEELPQTTKELAGAICRVKRFKRGMIHPATKTFQALRIAVNDELDHLERFLRSIPLFLSALGRVVIISYHSLEDRLVKRYFSSLEKDGIGIVETRSPLNPSEEEIMRNPRSRSAKMRVFKALET